MHNLTLGVNQLLRILHIYRCRDSNQYSFETFFLPFSGKLSGESRWVKLADLIPWEDHVAALLGIEAAADVAGSHWQGAWPAGVQLEIYAPTRTRPQPHQGGLLALCLQRFSEWRDPKSVLNAWLKVAGGLGAALGEPPRSEQF